MAVFKLHKYYYDKDSCIAYSDNEVVSDMTYIIFPPGVSCENYFIDLERVLPKDKHIIVMGYPNRGGSSCNPESNQLVVISEIAKQFLKIISGRKILIGLSYGTAVVTLLSQNLRTDNDLQIQEIDLVNAGEFFGNWQNRLLKFVFYLPAHSLTIARFYRFVICKILNFFSSQSFPDQSLQDINMQWLSILNYKIPKHSFCDIKTRIIISSSDPCVECSSKDKLSSFFSQVLFLDYNGNHVYRYKQELQNPSFFKLFSTFFD